MENILAEQGLELTYWRDPSRHDAFDPCRLLEDLYGEGAARAMLPWQNGLRMADSDHLVVATVGRGERCIGVLAATDCGTQHEPFLWLDAAYLAPSAHEAVFFRMLALAMLRIAGNESVPTVIAACVQTPGYLRMLRAFGRQFDAAALFPPAPDDVVIDLGMASLARRVGRTARPGARCIAANAPPRAAFSDAAAGQPMPEMLVVVDLSAAREATVLQDARRLYRARHMRAARRVMPAAAPLRGITAR
jgi:hypothetical protein